MERTTIKITDVKLFVLEQPNAKARAHRLVEVPNLHRIQYTHLGRPTDRPLRQAFIQVEADQGLVGRCDTHTIYYEHSGTVADSAHRLGRSWGLLNAPTIEDGHIVPPTGPGWGAEWDEDKFQSLVVERH